WRYTLTSCRTCRLGPHRLLAHCCTADSRRGRAPLFCARAAGVSILRFPSRAARALPEKRESTARIAVRSVVQLRRRRYATDRARLRLRAHSRTEAARSTG